MKVLGIAVVWEDGPAACRVEFRKIPVLRETEKTVYYSLDGGPEVGVRRSDIEKKRLKSRLDSQRFFHAWVFFDGDTWREESLAALSVIGGEAEIVLARFERGARKMSAVLTGIDDARARVVRSVENNS